MLIRITLIKPMHKIIYVVFWVFLELWFIMRYFYLGPPKPKLLALPLMKTNWDPNPMYVIKIHKRGRGFDIQEHAFLPFYFPWQLIAQIHSLDKIHFLASKFYGRLWILNWPIKVMYSFHQIKNAKWKFKYHFQLAKCFHVLKEIR